MQEGETDGEETEVVSVEHLDLPIEEEIVTNAEQIEDSLGFLKDASLEGLSDDTADIATDDVGLLLDKTTEDVSNSIDLYKLEEDIVEKQKGIEFELEEKEDDFSNKFAEEIAEKQSEKLEDTARSITSALDKSLLRIAQEEEVEVKLEEATDVVEEDTAVPMIPATMEVLEQDLNEEDKFALKHIFDTPTPDKEDDYMNTEQISEEAIKQVQTELNAKLKTLNGEDAILPTLERSTTEDMSDLIQQEVQEIIQKDIADLEQEMADSALENEDDLKLNTAAIEAYIEQDKEDLKSSILDQDEEDVEGEYPENEIESDLIMNLKAKVESYKKKKKSFESWLKGSEEEEEQPKVKLSEEDESEIKKFVDFQSEMNEGKSLSSTPEITESPLQGTESMAEVYAQQGHYDRAVKIYKQLSLKYPEKSSYFAGKIVELQKKL